MFGKGRKFTLTLIGVAIVLCIGIASALLKRFVDVDITELAKWAMVTITGSIGIGAGSIAYEDARNRGV